MRTFKGSANMEFKFVVPEGFLEEMRKAAQAEDATPFLKAAQARHPEKDDEFLAMILSNGTRIVLRSAMLDQLAGSAIGGTVSPVTCDVYATAFDHDAPANPDTIVFERAKGGAPVPRKVAMSPALAAQYGMGGK